MNDTHLPRIRCTLAFSLPEEGGRSAAPPDLSGGQYRPHLIISNLANPNDHDHLGVVFIGGPPHPKFGERVTSEFACAYYPSVDYSVLQPGVNFQVVEGSRIVAHGSVLPTSGFSASS